MLPAIILFLALLASISSVINIIDFYIGKNPTVAVLSVLFSVISSALWSYLFYLLH